MSEPAFRHGLANCPGCRTELIAPFHAAGRRVRCKSCGTKFNLPASDELFDSAVAFLLDYEPKHDRHDELGQVTPQILQETMVRDQSRAHADVSWLG